MYSTPKAKERAEDCELEAIGGWVVGGVDDWTVGTEVGEDAIVCVGGGTAIGVACPHASVRMIKTIALDTVSNFRFEII
jgi:outer membrane lipoprotein SlyB